MEIRGIVKRMDIEMVEGSCTVADTIAKMMDRNVGSVLVKRLSPSEPYGIITKQDVLFKVIAEGLDPNTVIASDIMSSPVMILNNVDLDVRYAAKSMANAGINYLAIFDGGDFYGFLSATDIINAVRRELTVRSLQRKSEDVSGGC